MDCNLCTHSTSLAGAKMPSSPISPHNSLRTHSCMFQLCCNRGCARLGNITLGLVCYWHGFETSSCPLGVLQVVMFFTVLLVPLTLHGALSTSWAHAMKCFWPVSAHSALCPAARSASMLTTGYKAAALLQVTHVAV